MLPLPSLAERVADVRARIADPMAYSYDPGLLANMMRDWPELDRYSLRELMGAMCEDGNLHVNDVTFCLELLEQAEREAREGADA